MITHDEPAALQLPGYLSCASADVILGKEAALATRPHACGRTSCVGSALNERWLCAEGPGRPLSTCGCHIAWQEMEEMSHAAALGALPLLSTCPGERCAWMARCGGNAALSRPLFFRSAPSQAGVCEICRLFVALRRLSRRARGFSA